MTEQQEHARTAIQDKPLGLAHRIVEIREGLAGRVGKFGSLLILDQYNALAVLVKTPATVKWLAENDPKALEQALEALG